MSIDLFTPYADPSDDPLAREVARRQHARLRAASQPPPMRTWAPSRWAHVPLHQLFAEAGCIVYRRSSGWLETGHPAHASKSGRCLAADPTTGRWWCRSCRRSGDAATFVQDLYGWTYRQAAQYLAERYGPPAGTVLRRAPRRVLEA